MKMAHVTHLLSTEDLPKTNGTTSPSASEQEALKKKLV
jgi:hypothetical protein